MTSLIEYATVYSVCGVGCLEIVQKATGRRSTTYYLADHTRTGLERAQAVGELIQANEPDVDVSYLLED